MSTKKFTTRHGIDANYQDIVSANNVSTNTLTALVSTGTPPLSITSTTKVNNLNVDLLDSYHASISNTANTVVVRDANTFISLNGIYMNSSEGMKRIAWNDTYSTYDMQLLDGVTLQVGQESHIYGRATENIQNGQVVMFAGAQGDGLLLRVANTQISGFEPRWLVGIATQTIPQNNWGYVTWFGKVSDLDTHNYSLGDILYLDNSVAGGLTNVKPTAPNYAVSMAAVVRVANSPTSNNGILMVRPDFGDSLAELHDVRISNASANDVLIYSSANTRWENKTQTAITSGDSDKLDGQHGSYYTTLSNNAFVHANSAFASSNTKFSSSGGTVSGDVIITGNVAIGKATAGYTLDVNGTANAASYIGSGASLTNLTAGNLSGTIPSAVLGNSTLYIGTSGVALNRASASLSLTGVSIDGSSGSVTNSLTFNTSGGAAAGITYNGSAARTIDYSTVGAAASGHTHNYAGSSSAGGAATSSNLWNAVSGTTDLNSQPMGQQGSNSYANDTTSNLPVSPGGAAQWWNTLNLGASTRWTQIACQAYGDGAGNAPQNDIWIRSKHDADWSSWYRVLTSKNYNSYAPTLTGGGASGSWGISVTGSSASCTGNAATATSADNIDGIAFKNSNSGSSFVVDTQGTNGIGYSTGYTLFGQTDGGVYCSTFSADWQHQINGDFRTGQIAVRGKNNGTWQAWRAVLDASNYTSYAMPAGASATNSVDVRAPVFYDSNNTGYYIDPNSTSNIYGLTVNQTITGSVSGNAGTVAGLSVHSGRNNEANKVVRTDGSGYIQAGWINTTSGDLGVATKLDRVYCSYDGYVRYLGHTDFKTQMGLSAKNSFNRREYTTDANYWVGSMGWGSTYGANEIFGGGSGFIDIWSGTNFPSGTGHLHGFQALHYTTSSIGGFANGYGIQFVGQHGQDGIYFGRSCSNGTFTSWRRFLTEDIWHNSKYFASDGRIYGTIFYDSNDTAYYIDPNSTSNLYNVNMYYGHCGNFAGTTANGTATAQLQVQNAGGTGDNDVAAISFHCGGYYGGKLHLRHDGYFGYGGWSAATWRWYVNGSGDMTAAGNVTAYSDPRLKEEITLIESPIEKVKQMNGVKFKWKETSEIGHSGEYDYGILSSDIEKVAPELVIDSVFDAPEGDKYKTVAYDKLVPFLIEAIKEQQSKIEHLESQINKFIN